MSNNATMDLTVAFDNMLSNIQSICIHEAQKSIITPYGTYCKNCGKLQEAAKK